MSEISRELQAQIDAEVAPVMKKMFGNIPTIDTNKERLRFLNDRIREEEEKALAESQNRR